MNHQNTAYSAIRIIAIIAVQILKLAEVLKFMSPSITGCEALDRFHLPLKIAFDHPLFDETTNN